MTYEIFDLKEAKEKLGYANESYLRALISSGKIKAVKIGNAWAISQAEIDRILALRSEQK